MMELITLALGFLTCIQLSNLEFVKPASYETAQQQEDFEWNILYLKAAILYSCILQSLLLYSRGYQRYSTFMTFLKYSLFVSICAVQYVFEKINAFCLCDNDAEKCLYTIVGYCTKQFPITHLLFLTNVMVYNSFVSLTR